MSGHSKWATTKHKKAAIDAKRGKLFARLIKNIEVAARTGGGDPAGNPTLYDAIQKAKKNSVPADNIKRAVNRGSGAEAGGADWQTISYEGYGPAGVAMLVECLTDNKNRAAADVRTAFNKNGGNLADGIDEDAILMAVLDAGAEEVVEGEDTFTVLCDPATLVEVRTALQEAQIEYDSAEVRWQATTEVELDLAKYRQVMRLIDALDDSDDVQDVFTNLTVSPEVQAQYEEEE